MASAAGMRPDVIAREFAGERAAIAIVRAVGRGREEVAGFRFRAGEEAAKETDSVVNII
jgi:hypothetical protein